MATIASTAAVAFFMVIMLYGRPYNKDDSSPIASNDELHDDDKQHQQQHDARRIKGGQGIVVVVMPSPPMVSGPMTRIDRLMAIQETWGRDLIIAGHARPGGEEAANPNRLVSNTKRTSS